MTYERQITVVFDDPELIEYLGTVEVDDLPVIELRCNVNGETWQKVGDEWVKITPEYTWTGGG